MPSYFCTIPKAVIWIVQILVISKLVFLIKYWNLFSILLAKSTLASVNGTECQGESLSGKEFSWN